MEVIKDQHGVDVRVGDWILYHHSRQNGYTGLHKAQVVSITKTGRPQIAWKKHRYDTPDGRWIPGAEIIWYDDAKTLVCNFAKGHEN